MNAAGNTMATQVEDYAGRVRAALSDLPAGARDELLADLPDHLAEVAGEDGDTDLEARLGPPEAYAAELRSAAGLVPAPAATLRDRARGWRDEPWLRATAEFLPELRPGWWVVRGLLLATVPTAFLGFGLAYWVLLSIPAVVGSVLVGRRSAAGDRWRFAGHAMSLGAAFVAAGALFLAAGTGSAPPSDPAYETAYPGLVGVTNFYVYGPDGTPLRDVQIFDQDGNPVVPPSTTDAEGNQITAVPRYDPQGRVVPNVYPQEQTRTRTTYELDGTGPVVSRVTPPVVTPTMLAPR